MLTNQHEMKDVQCLEEVQIKLGASSVIETKQNSAKDLKRVGVDTSVSALKRNAVDTLSINTKNVQDDIESNKKKDG